MLSTKIRKSLTIITVFFVFAAIYSINFTSSFLLAAELYTGNPPTIVHDFLDIEKPFGAGPGHVKIINNLINKAVIKIHPGNNYSTDDAIKILSGIHNLLKEEGFIFKPNYMLFTGLESRNIDCDNYSAIYTAIAEILKLPVIPVNAPNHSFVRFIFNDGTYINWDTVEGKHYTDAMYAAKLNISRHSIINGVFLKSLQRKEFMGIEYNNIGAFLLSNKKYGDSVIFFSRSIQYYPVYSSAYHNRGTAYYALNNREKAFSDLTTACSLDPNRAGTHNTLGDIYFDYKKYNEAIKEYNICIELEPSYWVPYYSKGLVYRAMGNANEAEIWLEKAEQIKQKYSK